ncbi:MAG: thioredoxin-dependent thiol peroxidase [Patescibacteria group bacterium]
MPLTVSTQAPEFSLPDQDGKMQSLSLYRGKYVILYFYPKDDTPGCTKEACSFRDNFAVFKRAGVVILGMSADTQKRHAKFALKYSLPFTLLSDEDKKVLKKYKAWGKKKFMGREYEGVFRISYLIDPAGSIVKVYPNVKPDEHAEEVLADIKAAKKK